MAYVTIPKDLSKVKNKVFLNLTKRQLVCMGFAAGIGVPFYFLMRDTLGTSNAAAGMVLLMLPEFFFALYEKNGIADSSAAEFFGSVSLLSVVVFNRSFSLISVRK